MLLIPVNFILGPLISSGFVAVIWLSANSVKIIWNSSTAALLQDPRL